MAASTGRIKSLSIVTTSAILPISKSCIKNCLTFQSTSTCLARTPLRMENHQPNSEAVQHHSALFIFVLHPYAPKERKAVQPRHHRAAVPNLPRRTSFLQGFLHIPYSIAQVFRPRTTLFALTILKRESDLY